MKYLNQEIEKQEAWKTRTISVNIMIYIIKIPSIPKNAYSSTLSLNAY